MKVTNGLLNSVPTIVSSGGSKHRSSTTSSAKIPIHPKTSTNHHQHVSHPVELQTNSNNMNIVSSNLASNLNEDDFIGSASEFIKGKYRSSLNQCCLVKFK